MKEPIICAALLMIVALGTCAAAETEIRLPSMESGNYAAHCSDEWTKRGVLDQKMFDYCVQRNRDGYEKLVAETRRYQSFPWLQSVVDAAITQWTKRGSRQDNMVAYEVHREIDAYLDLSYLKQQGALSEATADSCIREWTKASPQWTMIRYCYKRATGTD